MSTKQTATHLGRSPWTVATQRAQALRKLEAATMPGAVGRAYRLGLLP